MPVILYQRLGISSVHIGTSAVKKGDCFWHSRPEIVRLLLGNAVIRLCIRSDNENKNIFVIFLGRESAWLENRENCVR